MSVKTKSGDTATIIVKKREGGRNIRNFWVQDDMKWKPISRSEPVNSQRSSPWPSNVTSFDRSILKNETSMDATKQALVKTEIAKNVPQQNITINVKSTVKLDQKEEELKLASTTTSTENSDQKNDASTLLSVITSAPYQSEKYTRSINSADSAYPQPISTGSYSESNFVPIQSKFVERKLVPEPITITSSLSLGSQSSDNAENDENRQSRKLYVDRDGIPVITGIRVPDDESDRQVWRNARVINGILVPYAKNHNSKYPQKDSHVPMQPHGSNQWMKSEQKKPISTILKENKPLRSELITSSTNPPPINLMLIEEQDDKWQKLGTVSNVNMQDMSNKFRPSSVWIKDDIRQSQDQNYVSDKILDYIKQINQHETSHRSVRKVEDRDARAFLEEDAGRSYFSSTTLTPPRVSFEGVRTPVLQYAHPELGVQPAKIVSTTAPQKESEVEPILDSRAQALAYFAHDIHADRSPFAFEPGLEEEARVQESFDSKSVKPITRPKKTITYPSPKYIESNMPLVHHNKYEYSSKYPFSYKGYNGYYTHIHEPEKPMWRKISDTVKDHVQSGFEKVSNLTRPVVEPLMEATNKISQNLGLSSGNRDLHTFKEKVGLAGGPSILLPALGLVAGGAALGLGAVAIGR